MTWSMSFFGTRQEIISKINAEEFPPEAHPVQAVRQFIGGQLPTQEQEPEVKMQYSVSAGGSVSSSDGRHSGNLYVSVIKAGIKPEENEKATETAVGEEGVK